MQSKTRIFNSAITTVHVMRRAWVLHYPAPALPPTAGRRHAAVWGPRGHPVWQGGGLICKSTRPAGPVCHPAVIPSAVLLLSPTGLPVNEQILHLMALRYGDVYRRMGFADFVSCMMRLETMTCESWSFITGCLRSQADRRRQGKNCQAPQYRLMELHGVKI